MWHWSESSRSISPPPNVTSTLYSITSPSPSRSHSPSIASLTSASPSPPSSPVFFNSPSPPSSPLVLDLAPPQFGEMTLKPWTKPSITILLIGETGVGKTAFLDLLANMCAGRELQAFTPIHERGNEVGGSATGSQTKKPVLYRIACANGSEVRILDTPGLADTRGLAWDNKHKAAIAESIKNETETIDSVVILANGTQERLGIATQYALTVISAMFPHSILDNIAFVFTMVSNPFQFNFQRSALPPEMRQAKVWTIENPLAQWVKFQSRTDIDDDVRVDMQDTLSTCYKKTLKTINEFFQWHDERTIQPVDAINDLYLMTTKIEASISDVVARIAQAEEMRRELSNFQAQLKKQDQIRMVNAQYESIIKKPFHVHTSTVRHNTLCVAGGCYSNCHVPCGLKFTLDRQQLGRCQAFAEHRPSREGGFICSACGHSSQLHQHYRAKWTENIQEEISIDQDAKQRYEEATTEKEKIEILNEQINDGIKALEERTRVNEDELSNLCSSFNELALSGSFVGHISSAIHLLELRYKAMQDEGIDGDALQRMAEHIDTLKKKKGVVEEAERKKRTKYSVVVWDKLRFF